MYNVKGPSKIVAKTRRGISKNVDNLKIESREKNGNYSELKHGPKPVFQKVYKRINNNNNNTIRSIQDVVTPQHEEIINYVSNSWNCISLELDSNSEHTDHLGRTSPAVLYYEDEPATELENFKPFDLESWWGKRLFTYITNSVSKN